MKKNMYTMGVDIGSSSSKMVVLADGKDIVLSDTIQAGTGSTGPEVLLETVYKELKEKGISKEDVAYTIVTGYGRFSFEQADNQLTEIVCHARGIHFLVPEARTILDIGGQDAKAIALSDQGKVLKFFMNDKCAAGTGRFIDVMSRVLEISLDEMQEYDKLSTSPVTISSTCTVFAESEVISQLSKGSKKEDIIAGVHNSTASKVSGLLHRTGMHDKIVMCGGVAKNGGVVRALKQELKRDVVVAPNPQITGALGAAIFAYDEVNK